MDKVTGRKPGRSVTVLLAIARVGVWTLRRQISHLAPISRCTSPRNRLNVTVWCVRGRVPNTIEVCSGPVPSALAPEC